MGKIKGNETADNLPDKVLLIYEATRKLLENGADINKIKVADITEEAGIGKGTAYDYFDSKEDIIVCSILFYMNNITQGIVRDMEPLSFKDRILFLFDTIDVQFGKRDCFLRFVHLASSASPITNSLKEAVKKFEQEIHTPLSILCKVIDDGIQGGQITRILPKEYILYTIGSKILSYAIMVEESRTNVRMRDKKFDRSQMRDLICDSILQEFENGKKCD